MLGRRWFALVAALGVTFLGGCGGGSSSTPGSSTPVSLSIRDNPPAGVTVLTFQITVSAVNLEPGDVPLLSNPVRIELKQLEAETAFLNTAGAQPGNYTGIKVTFANPEMTILNNSGAPIGNCLNGAVCELKPTLNESSVTVPVSLNIMANAPIGLLLDFDVNASVQGNLSVTPAVSFTQLPPLAPTGELEELEVVGRVTAKDSGMSQFTLQVVPSGVSLTVKVDGNTQFKDFDKIGQPNSFASIAVGQVLEVELRLMTGGMLVAKEVEFEDNANNEDLDGIIVAVNSPTQFQMVLTDELVDVPGISTGNLIQVNLQVGTSFRVDDDGLPVGGFLFASAADLLVGQRVEVRVRSGPSGTPPSISTDRVTLKKGSLTAKVKQVLSSTDFLVDNLSALFTNVGITQIRVSTSSMTDFEGVPSVSALNTGDAVSVRGLLFKTPGGPVLVAKKVRKR